MRRAGFGLRRGRFGLRRGGFGVRRAGGRLGSAAQAICRAFSPLPRALGSRHRRSQSAGLLDAAPSRRTVRPLDHHGWIGYCPNYSRGQPPVGGSIHPLKRSLAETLSDRELEVFQLISHGLDTERIADKMRVSPKTVETYRARIKEKLHLNSGPELIRRAVEWRLEDC